MNWVRKRSETDQNSGAWERQYILEEKVRCVTEVLGLTGFYADYQIFPWAQDGLLTWERATGDGGQAPSARGQSPLLDRVCHLTVSTASLRVFRTDTFLPWGFCSTILSIHGVTDFPVVPAKPPPPQEDFPNLLASQALEHTPWAPKYVPIHPHSSEMYLWFMVVQWCMGWISHSELSSTRTGIWFILFTFILSSWHTVDA